MSSLIDYICMKSLDNCVVITINLMSPSRNSIEFMMGNTILAPRWFLFSSTTLLPSVQHNLFVFCVNLEITATQQLIFLTSEVLPSLLSRMWWEFHHLLIILDIIILLAIFVHSLVPVLFSTGIPTMELWRVNSKLLATLLLWSEWAIVHSKSFANWITILTLVVQPNPYFGRTFQPMFNCVCFPRAYFLISFDLTNVISLFT